MEIDTSIRDNINYIFYKVYINLEVFSKEKGVVDSEKITVEINQLAVQNKINK